MTIRDPVVADGETIYSVMVTKLNEHFLPKVNKTYERSIFRSMNQLQSESIDQFITRLRQRAVYCDFGNVDEMITQQAPDVNLTWDIGCILVTTSYNQ